MAIVPKFYGEVAKGSLLLDSKENFTNYYKTLEGKRVEMVLKEYKKDRSGQQNRYYFSVPVKMISDYTGFTVDETHAFLADKFLGFDKLILGKEIRIVPTTTKLKTHEFEDYLRKIREWASIELKLFIPDPNSCAY